MVAATTAMSIRIQTGKVPGCLHNIHREDDNCDDERRAECANAALRTARCHRALRLTALA